ncbi:MAG: sodium-dependent transporter [Paludibacteraceae bacterium]|nr:sodium-dependent transporter [Paludibacteraceae bacterium]MCM8871701.1 sodium-dependent transporter [Paludibacteraceae bacterium]
MAQGTFKSSIGTFAAVAGSVVGLGNIWRFPYLAGENGGFAFLIVYLFVSLLVSLPVMLSEFSIGRSQRCNAMRSFKQISGGPWFLTGMLGVATAYVIDSFYMVVGGWSLEFLRKSVMNEFSGISPERMTEEFNAYIADGTGPVIWALVSLVLATTIIILGVSKGIEKMNKIMMPTLVLILVILVINSIFFLPNSQAGIDFLLHPDFSKITFKTLLAAVGQSFFSLSLGMGAMLTYASYIQEKEHLPSTALRVMIFDSSIALLSGLAIFPAVFSFGIDPSSGPHLLFLTMPNIFQQIIGGQFLSIIFFLFVFLAAITSQVSLLEVVTAFVSEELKIKRWKAAIWLLLTMGITGSMCALSQSDMDIFVFNGHSLFDIFDYVSSNYMLPIGGLLIVIFAGRIMPERILQSQLTNGNEKNTLGYTVIKFLIRYVSPIFISLMFLDLIGLIK